MPNENQNNSFSWGDALFLYIEREGQPLNIAGVSVFEGEIKLADFRAFVESKLPLIPRYLQRVVFPPFDLGLPSWEFDRQLRHPEPHSQSKPQARDGAGAQVAGRKDREHPAGPGAAALGFHPGTIARRAHGNCDANSPLPGRRNCRRGRDECHHGHDSGAASDCTEAT